jgi:hypothetical protein
MLNLENSFDVYGNWVFIAPIENLVLTDAVEKEFRIGRVLFVKRDKIARIRRRLGFHQRVSDIKGSKLGKPFEIFLEKANTFAIVRKKGNPSQIDSECLNLVKEALNILSVSQLGYANRNSTGYIGLYGGHEPASYERVLLNSNNPAKSISRGLLRTNDELVLDKRWVEFHKKAFFFDLLKILFEKRQLSKSWRDDLRRASEIIGQSINSQETSMCFLRNMIAIELLLTRQGDVYSDSLTKRVEAFIGWTTYWQNLQYPELIKSIYKKRCAMVHSGIVKEIKDEDVKLTDELVFNLMANIVKCINIFKSKDDLINFSELVYAERLLGAKPKIRPKQFRYFKFGGLSKIQ